MTELIGVAGARIAIANRGEIAVRIAATGRRLGAVPVALLGDPDLNGYAARTIGRVERIGEAGSELDVERVVAAARRAGAAYLHPGYGFLSERADLSAACAAAGIRFIGPSPETLRLCGDKLATRAAAQRAAVPLLPASPPLGEAKDEWLPAARAVGYPLLVKPAGGGGGRGMRRVAGDADLIDAVAASRRESAASGAGAVLYLERELVDARHVEVQVAGDGARSVALGDRDCSLQRRSQKVIEEAPAPGLSDGFRRELHDHARRIAEAVGLAGIATCEFLLGADGTLAFLEVNPRIQVEHPVTELIIGFDLVAWQLAIASGKGLPAVNTPEPRGHSIEARVYAEDPANGFFPSIGALETVQWPSGPGIRVDAGYASGDTVPNAYDAMLAKVVAHGADRETALAALRQALGDTVVAGLATNVSWLIDLLDAEETRAGRATIHTAAAIQPTKPDHRPALLAAVAHTLDRGSRHSDDPWTAIGPFRLSGAASLAFHGDGWEERATVARSGDGWLLGDGDVTEPIRWWRDTAGVWTVAAGETVARVAIVQRDDQLEIAGHGGRWTVRTSARPSGERARRDRPSDGIVRASLPAKVLQIHVAAGDRVEAGQPLVTLTAMKMELASTAPGSGTVQSVTCAVNDQVESGAVLVILTLDDADRILAAKAP